MQKLVLPFLISLMAGNAYAAHPKEPPFWDKPTDYFCVLRFSDLQSNENVCKTSPLHFIDGGALIGVYMAVLPAETANFKVFAGATPVAPPFDLVLASKDRGLPALFTLELHLTPRDGTESAFMSKAMVGGASQVMRDKNFESEVFCVSSKTHKAADFCVGYPQ